MYPQVNRVSRINVKIEYFCVIVLLCMSRAVIFAVVEIILIYAVFACDLLARVSAVYLHRKGNVVVRNDPIRSNYRCVDGCFDDLVIQCICIAVIAYAGDSCCVRFSNYKITAVPAYFVVHALGENLVAVLYGNGGHVRLAVVNGRFGLIVRDLKLTHGFGGYGNDIVKLACKVDACCV